MILFHEISCRYTYASLAACARNGYCEPLSRYFCSGRGGVVFGSIHPWHIPATVTPVVRNEMNVLASLAGHPQVLAIGEAGLDKLADAPMVVQIKVFEYQARLSVELDKPLVIHLVKAMSELLKLKQQIKPANPWIIHGFRGKAALAEECLRHGFYLSFGEKYQEEALRITPADRLFLETDESSVPVADLYSRAAEVRRVSLAELTEAIRENIAKVFFKQ